MTRYWLIGLSGPAWIGFACSGETTTVEEEDLGGTGGGPTTVAEVPLVANCAEASEGLDGDLLVGELDEDQGQTVCEHLLACRYSVVSKEALREMHCRFESVGVLGMDVSLEDCEKHYRECLDRDPDDHCGVPDPDCAVDVTTLLACERESAQYQTPVLDSLPTCQTRPDDFDLSEWLEEHAAAVTVDDSTCPGLPWECTTFYPGLL